MIPSEDAQTKGGNGTGAAKRLLEGEGTSPPEPKRTKTDNEENPSIGPDNRFHVSVASDAGHGLQKGKRNEKKKGRRQGPRSPVEDDPNRPKTPRLPKKQCAVLIGFSGTGYAGMQM